jgi:hypothetical protein
VYIFEAEPLTSQSVIIGLNVVFSLLFGTIFYYGLNTMLLTNLFEKLAVSMVLVSGLAIVLNIFSIITAVNKFRFAARYNRYFEQLKFHRIEAVDNIAEITGCKRSLVVKDLKKAVKKKYIPEGHFGRSNFLFMVSEQIYNGYQQKPAVYDHYFMGKIEERERMRGHNSDTQRILETGNTYIEKIHDSNDLIKDKAVTEKLNRMEKTVSMIFKEVDLHPEQSEKLGLFLNYYLPTTDKLLKNYISIIEKGIESRSLSATLHELSESLDTINTAFEKILEMLYVEQETDILSDIETLETMMRNEGLISSGD